MSWFFSSTSTPSTPKPKLSTDGTPIAPDRSERVRCWEARDLYFKCLDNHDILDSIKEGDKAAKECKVEGKEFEANCATSWVVYFKKRRVMEYKKAKTLEALEAEGAEELSPGSFPSGPR